MFARLKRIAPRRGWRAFIGEVGIIVLGVLIAVGIGKVVEALDWRDKVAAARTALDDDLRANAFFIISERRAVTPCLRRQLDRLEASVLGDPSGTTARARLQPGQMVPSVYVHPTRPWDTLEWSSVLADNLPAHMPRRDRVFYRELYHSLALMGAHDLEETRETADLDLLSRPIALDARTRDDLLRIIARERQRIALMDGFSQYTLDRMREHGFDFKLTAAELGVMNTSNWCRANGLL